MASKTVAGILRTRSAPFTEEQIEAMTDRDGWSWIYGHDKEKKEYKAPTMPKICFTGFFDEEKERLHILAGRQVYWSRIL